ncbi:MAG: DHHW family protein [Dorea sp.]|nr:DHHW family protein [Dorea sp.]
MSKMSRKKRAQLNKRRLVSILFVVAFALIMIANLVIPDRVHAGKEYRDLAQKPKLSGQALIDGTYMDDFESYLTDQFNGHNKLTRLRARVSLLLGIRKTNGVYKGKHGYLLEEIKPIDEEQMQQTVTAMQEFERNYPTVPMYVALVPNAASILKDQLPSHVRVLDQNAQFDEIYGMLASDFKTIDLFETMLAHRDEAVYYHTDEHWTSLGTYYAYNTLLDQLDLNQDLAIAYNTYAVSNDFTGSMAGLSGYERTYRDNIYIYNASNDGSAIKVVVDASDVEEDVATLYDNQKLDTENQYRLFLGGDHPFVSIRTDADSSDKLLLVKNSFANSLVPFLTPFYREIVMVDPDYYTENLNNLMKEYKFNKVLFLFDGNSFVENTTLAGVLANND